MDTGITKASQGSEYFDINLALYLLLTELFYSYHEPFLTPYKSTPFFRYFSTSCAPQFTQ